ncbi:hypothetical protein DL93DRAFT_1966064 [Clavulina sp. PMI_390]|nr:hypothetical protein DL93DRAFT_1966064 [Clavulina sp. PMI_390]
MDESHLELTVDNRWLSPGETEIFLEWRELSSSEVSVLRPSRRILGGEARGTRAFASSGSRPPLPQQQPRSSRNSLPPPDDDHEVENVLWGSQAEWSSPQKPVCDSPAPHIYHQGLEEGNTNNNAADQSNPAVRTLINGSPHPPEPAANDRTAVDSVSTHEARSANSARLEYAPKLGVIHYTLEALQEAIYTTSGFGKIPIEDLYRREISWGVQHEFILIRSKELESHGNQRIWLRIDRTAGRKGDIKKRYPIPDGLYNQWSEGNPTPAKEQKNSYNATHKPPCPRAFKVTRHEKPVAPAPTQ